MPTIFVTTRSGEERTVEGEVGKSLMQTIREGGITEVEALCGGNCLCATCHVFVDEAWFDKVSERSRDEEDLLDMSEHRGAFSRLSCQIRLTDELDGLRVTVAPQD